MPSQPASHRLNAGRIDRQIDERNRTPPHPIRPINKRIHTRIIYTTPHSSWSRKHQELKRAHDRLKVLFGAFWLFLPCVCLHIHVSHATFVTAGKIESDDHTTPTTHAQIWKKQTGYDDAPLKRNTSEAHAFLGKWDLGTRRTLEQLIEFTGLDTRKKEVRRVVVCGFVDVCG